MDKTLQEKFVSAIKVLEKKVAELEKDINLKDKRIKQLEKLTQYAAGKQDLAKLQRRINTLEAELTEVSGYLRRKASK